MKHGLYDYLDVLRISGLHDWGPFRFTSEELAEFDSRFAAISQGESRPVSESESLAESTAPSLVASVAEQTSPEPIPEMPKKKAVSSPPFEPVAATSAPVAVKNRGAALALLASEVAQCEKCKELADTRTQTVFGTGNPFAKLLFLGEAPGADEDKQGVPFVGRAGQLLTDMITKGMKLNRDDVYICNILRCRPPGNRNPEKKEAANCRPFLDRTIEIIQPKFICCLGTIAAQNLLGTEEPIGHLRGKVLQYKGMKVVCTYHPAYLLRNPAAKGKTWEDLQVLMKEMGLPVK